MNGPLDDHLGLSVSSRQRVPASVDTIYRPLEAKIGYHGR